MKIWMDESGRKYAAEAAKAPSHCLVQFPSVLTLEVLSLAAGVPATDEELTELIFMRVNGIGVFANA